ncbi:hypothetical protein, partial [Citrobacter werkmanii]|uniref:hypothetical protein n=1 Tax=Citrobacter werkmanii TaxID=67827 RepID=UPI001F492164
RRNTDSTIIWSGSQKMHGTKTGLFTASLSTSPSGVNSACNEQADNKNKGRTKKNFPILFQ